VRVLKPPCDVDDVFLAFLRVVQRTDVVLWITQLAMRLSNSLTIRATSAATDATAEART
jgi:hypothetical protein